MAEAFRKMGRPAEAVQIMVFKNEDAGNNAIAQHRTKKRYLKLLGDVFWFCLFGKLIDFGYHPWRALIPSVGFVLFGAFLFGLVFREQIVPTKDNAYEPNTRNLTETYPPFNALIYSLETFVPLVKLGMSEFWAPHRGPSRLYLWVHIILGWVLTTLWFAGLTGLIKG
jgi:hypothetical protein